MPCVGASRQELRIIRDPRSSCPVGELICARRGRHHSRSPQRIDRHRERNPHPQSRRPGRGPIGPVGHRARQCKTGKKSVRISPADVIDPKNSMVASFAGCCARAATGHAAAPARPAMNSRRVLIRSPRRRAISIRVVSEVSRSPPAASRPPCRPTSQLPFAAPH
jgi:hypothetical protein